MVEKEQVIEVLKTIFDPELPVNIYDLGLIYDIDIEEDKILINMTLTSPACPVAESLPPSIAKAIGEKLKIGVKVNVVWDPPWDQNKMTEAVKLQLGLL